MSSVTLNILLVYSLVQLTSNGIAGFELILNPTHRSYCTSQNLTISCTITNYHGNRTDLANALTFTYNNEPVEPNSVAIVNQTTAEYLVTGKHPTKNFFYVNCCLNKTCSKSQYPHGQMIHSYVSPEPVQNLTCVMHDVYEGPIHCSWVYGVDYTSSWNAPRVYFIWRLSDEYEWNTSHAVPLTTSSYDLDVTAEGPSEVDYTYSSVGVNVTSTECGYTEVVRNFYSVKIVQLSSIGDLHGSSINSSCIILTWAHTIYEDLMKVYHIHCDTVLDTTKDIQFTTTNQTEACLCDLIPATHYNCSVRVKLIPAGWKASRWSPDQSIIVKTLEDVPGSSPTVTAGSYAWDSQDGCTERRTITGSVWIYWKPIPPIQYNGIMKGTVITYNTGGTPERLLADNSNNYAKVDVDCQETHVVTLQAENNKGLSVEKSLLTIMPQQVFSELVPELIVEKEDNNTGSRYMEWSRPKQPVNNYTVFYAVKKPLGSCTSELISPVNWKFVSGNDNSTIINVNDKSLHCFGTSVQTEVGSSGIHWTDCVYGKQEVPSPPVDVSVTLGQTENTLRVSWGRRACSPDQPYISSYQVAYCPISLEIDVQLDRHCKESPKIVTCPSSVRSMTLDNLTADEYRVNVRAVTRFNVHGNWSLAIFQHTGNSSVEVIRQTKNNLTGGEIAAVVIASIIVLGCAVFSPYCIRRCNKRMKYLKQNIDLHIDPQSDQELCVNTLYQPNAEANESGLDNLAYAEDFNSSELQRDADKRDGGSNKQDNGGAIGYLPDGYVKLSPQFEHTSRKNGIHGTSTDGMAFTGFLPDGYVEFRHSSKQLKQTTRGDRINGTSTDVQDDVDVRNDVELPLSNANEADQESTNGIEDNMVGDNLDIIENQTPRGAASSDMSSYTKALSNIVDGYVYTENMESTIGGQAENRDSFTVSSNHEDNVHSMTEDQSITGAVDVNHKVARFDVSINKYTFNEANRHNDNKSDQYEIEIYTYSPYVKAESVPVLQTSSVSNLVSDCGHNNKVSKPTTSLAQHSKHMVKSKNNTSVVTANQLNSTQPSVQMESGYIEYTTIMISQHAKSNPQTKPGHMNHKPDMISNNKDDNLNVISGYVRCRSDILDYKANVPSAISLLRIDQQPDSHVLQSPSNNDCIRSSGYIDQQTGTCSSHSKVNPAMEKDKQYSVSSSSSNRDSIMVSANEDNIADKHSSLSIDNSTMVTGYIDQISEIHYSLSVDNSNMVTGYIDQIFDMTSSPSNVNSTRDTGYIDQISDMNSSPSNVNSTMDPGYIDQPPDIQSSPSNDNSTMHIGYYAQSLDTGYIDQPSEIHSSPSNVNSTTVNGYIGQPSDIHSSLSNDNSTRDTGYIDQSSEIHSSLSNAISTMVTGYIDRPSDIHSSLANEISTMDTGYIDQPSEIHSSPSNVNSTTVNGYIGQPSDIHSSLSNDNSTRDTGYIDQSSEISF